MNEITTVGVDLAKNVISVCGLDRQCRVVLARSMSPSAFARWAERQPDCLMGLEACGSAHHWARTLASYGHDVRLMPAHLVSPFRMSRAAKNDRNDPGHRRGGVPAHDALRAQQVGRAAMRSGLASAAGWLSG